MRDPATVSSLSQFLQTYLIQFSTLGAAACLFATCPLNILQRGLAEAQLCSDRAHLLPRYVFSMSPTEDRMDPMSYRRRSTVI